MIPEKEDKLEALLKRALFIVAKTEPESAQYDFNRGVAFGLRLAIIHLWEESEATADFSSFDGCCPLNSWNDENHGKVVAKPA